MSIEREIDRFQAKNVILNNFFPAGRGGGHVRQRLEIHLIFRTAFLISPLFLPVNHFLLIDLLVSTTENSVATLVEKGVNF